MVPRIPPARVLVPRVLILAGLALCGSVLRADLIYSNFGPGDAYSAQTAVVVSDGINDYSVAEELPTLTSSYLLSSIEFVASSPNPSPTDSVTVSIFSDNNGVPGTALESITLSGAQLQTSNQGLAPFDGSLSPVLTATSVQNPELLAGDNYWLVMDGPSGKQVDWDQNSTGTSGFTATNGTAGNYPSPGSNPNADETNGVFEVDGTLVGGGDAAPEPGTWVLMIAGMGTIAFLRQARR